MKVARRLKRMLGRVRRHPRTDATVKGLQASRAVRRPWRFLAAELLSVDRIVQHTLRATGGTLYLRHPRIDLWAFHEIFVLSVYEPPSAVRSALAPVGEELTIADVGAHVGLASRYLLDELAPARIVAFEPDPRNRAVLERMVAAEPARDRITVVAAAAATAAGRAQFSSHLHLSKLGSATAAGHQVEVEVVDALPTLAQAHLIKVDIQGGEWEILRDPRFAQLPARAVVIEYHLDGAPSSDPLTDVRRVLGDAGFEVGPPFEVRGHEGSVWAWRDRTP